MTIQEAFNEDFKEPIKPQPWVPPQTWLDQFQPEPGKKMRKSTANRMQKAIDRKNQELQDAYRSAHTQWATLLMIVNNVALHLPDTLCMFFTNIYLGQRNYYDSKVKARNAAIKALDDKYAPYNLPYPISHYYAEIPGKALRKKVTYIDGKCVDVYERSKYYSFGSTAKLIDAAFAAGVTEKQLYDDTMNVAKAAADLSRLGTRQFHLTFVLNHIAAILKQIYATGNNNWPIKLCDIELDEGCSLGYGGHFNGVLDYGTHRASFKSFLAGGWNIQRLHVRFRITQLVH